MVLHFFLENLSQTGWGEVESSGAFWFMTSKAWLYFYLDVAKMDIQVIYAYKELPSWADKKKSVIS